MRCNTVREATGGTKFAAGVYTPSASGTDTITTGFAPTAVLLISRNPQAAESSINLRTPEQAGGAFGDMLTLTDIGFEVAYWNRRDYGTVIPWMYLAFG